MKANKEPIQEVKIKPVEGNVLVIFDKEKGKPEKVISVQHAEILHKKGLITYK